MNKPRLIDENKLTERLEFWFATSDNEEWKRLTGLMISVIKNETPTAYDIDKVVQQLEREKNDARFAIRGVSEIQVLGYIEGLEYAIKIVKGGAE